MAQRGQLPMAAIVKVKTTAQRGSRWLKRRFNGARGSQTSTDTHNLCIGPPTNFRREELTLGLDAAGNQLLVLQAREDAHNMHKGSKMEKVKRHARKISSRTGTVGEANPFGGDEY
ncbi:hypothetical protein GJ744_011186 [Endocarpon pusillum]|uniref:Uncharacterized protein n=1 Tax=Endocarpon pusillum TaxID=364733 RepID=A0A8H7AKM0_9EURO|nr:hypothetical protein GJ744_011186 [Endocarpon pusillum]